MAKEIEYKFLVKPNVWSWLDLKKHKWEYIYQGYLSTTNPSVRVRTVNDTSAFITVKGKSTGPTRDEYEYVIPIKDAAGMLKMVQGSRIAKQRVYYKFGNHTWHVDVFDDDNLGLVTAEIELNDAKEEFIKPPWLRADVTNVGRFKNVNLSIYPFKDWTPDEQAFKV